MVATDLPLIYMTGLTRLSQMICGELWSNFLIILLKNMLIMISSQYNLLMGDNIF